MSSIPQKLIFFLIIGYLAILFPSDECKLVLGGFGLVIVGLILFKKVS